MKATLKDRVLLGVIGGLLVLCGSALIAAATLNWESLDGPQRLFVILSGAAAIAVGVGLLIIARPGGVTFRALKRLFILLIGSTVILFGIALLVLPGPGWVIIFAGLGILATEFAFARRILHKARETADYTANRFGISERLRQRLKLHSGSEQHPAEGTDS